MSLAERAEERALQPLRHARLVEAVAARQRAHDVAALGLAQTDGARFGARRVGVRRHVARQ